MALFIHRKTRSHIKFTFQNKWGILWCTVFGLRASIAQLSLSVIGISGQVYCAHRPYTFSFNYGRHETGLHFNKNRATNINIYFRIYENSFYQFHVYGFFCIFLYVSFLFQFNQFDSILIELQLFILLVPVHCLLFVVTIAKQEIKMESYNWWLYIRCYKLPIDDLAHTMLQQIINALHCKNITTIPTMDNVSMFCVLWIEKIKVKEHFESPTWKFDNN